MPSHRTDRARSFFLLASLVATAACGSTAGPGGAASSGTTGSGGAGSATSSSTGRVGVGGGASTSASAASGSSGAVLDGGACNAQLADFSASHWPPACYPFYAPTSFWNTPIAPSPALDPSSAAILTFYANNYHGFVGLGALSLGDPDSTQAFDHPLYFADASDPLFTLHCTESAWGTCTLEGKQIHVPSGAQHADGTDGHMGIVDTTSGIEYDMWQVTAVPTSAGGTLSCSWGGYGSFTGPGFTTSGGGATASGASLGAGTIRSEELIAGQINHVLFGVVSCCNGTAVGASAMYGGHCDTKCVNNQGGAVGQVYMLNMTDAEIDALGKSPAATAILKALAHYGFMDSDESAYAVGLLATSPTYERTSLGATDPIVAWAKAQGLPSDGNGGYTLDYGTDIDWASKLVVLAP